MSDKSEKPSVDWRAVSDTTQAPSHLLADGRAVVLPSPSAPLRRRWVERAILQHGLLQSWLDHDKKSDSDDEEQGGKTEGHETDQTQPGTSATQQIHPLALASSRLETEGIDELNRSINLTNLVSAGEYFRLTNIVADAALELAAAGAADGGDKTDKAPSEVVATTKGTAPAPGSTVSAGLGVTTHQISSDEFQNSQTLASTYVLKRKHQQFAQAASVLRRHRRRLQLGLPEDTKVLLRLAQLRHRWRLVAPDHGTRALPHPVRPTEAIACDIDTAGVSTSSGRLARRIPRYATLELREQPLHFNVGNTNPVDGSSSVSDHNTNEGEKEGAENTGNATIRECWTYAEPFALPDPTLGNLNAEFDPSKIEMLTLQFVLEHQSAANEGIEPNPKTSVSACLESTKTQDSTLPDEEVLFELQHSLLCSKLFESMRRELADDTEEVGNVRTTTQQSFQNVAWLAPTRGVAARTFHAAGRPDQNALQVVHVHEGQICVQLSTQYTLRVQLVPSSVNTTKVNATPSNINNTTKNPTKQARLLIWCKTLLWHAHSLYRQHFVQPGAETSQEKDITKGPEKKLKLASPHILQSCVGLGMKLLMERDLRQCFLELQTQRKEQARLPLNVICLSTSVFSPGTQWTLSCGSDWQADVIIEHGLHLIVTWWNQEDYRKVSFCSLGSFRLFLQHQLLRLP